MSGGITATQVMMAAAMAAAAYGAREQSMAAKDAAHEQRVMSEKATASAKEQASLAEQANNRMNQQRPDVGAMLSANQQASKAGGSSTMLTGPQGVDLMNLGKNTLLGS